MTRQHKHHKFLAILGLVTLGGLILVSVAVAKTEPVSRDRAAWLLERGSLDELALTGQRFDQGEVGGGAAGPELIEDTNYRRNSRGPGTGITILASAILPGSGEALMGYKRGYVMMALDVLCWTQVAKYHNDGKDKTDEYYAFADEHYSDQLLVEAYNGASEDQERSGEGAQYFNDVGNITSIDDLENLPLYVTKEADRREYYENLGKWDQFIFGWDDYLRHSFWGPEYGYEATGNRVDDLQQPWVSRNREIYRDLRDQANDAYKTRDRFMYLNIGLRVVSVLQVAYLNGLMGGGPDSELKVSGHTVEIITEPMGLTRGTLAARVSF